MGDELILYDHDQSLVHHLNPSAAILWRLCDGEATVAQLAREIGEELGVDVDQVARQADGAIAELDALGLLKGAPPHE
jgi:PqqD family protein of HPr-rel-A system